MIQVKPTSLSCIVSSVQVLLIICKFEKCYFILMPTVSVNSTCFNADCLLADRERQGERGVQYFVGGGEGIQEEMEKLFM